MQSDDHELPDSQDPGSPEASAVQAEHESAVDDALENASEGAGDAMSGSNVDQRLAEADREVLRAKAELENFRKRMQRDSELQLKYANMPLVRDLIEVVDNLQRAIDAAGEEGATIEALREGVDLVNQQLAGVLGKFGCKPIEALAQPFDPNFHEAIAQMPSSEHESGVVMQEVAVGYKLHDRVVRPSNVIVSTGAADS